LGSFRDFHLVSPSANDPLVSFHYTRADYRG
jgi:hypothetical protein